MHQQASDMLGVLGNTEVKLGKFLKKEGSSLPSKDGNLKQLTEDPSNAFEKLNITPRITQHAQVQDNQFYQFFESEDKLFHGTEPDKPKKIGVQESFADNHDSYIANIVVSGTRLAVRRLLDAVDQPEFQSWTTGVLYDHSIRANKDGQYKEGRDFKEVEQLGKGGFGTVNLCQHKSGKLYATKKVEKLNKTELLVLMCLSHQNITAFYGYIQRNGTHEILMEFGGLSLKTYVKSEKEKGLIEWKEVKEGLRQLSFGLKHMHDQGIIHLDLKPDNILRSEDGGRATYKITDLGSSKIPGQPLSLEGWTPEYTSPEACLAIVANKNPAMAPNYTGDDLTGKADVFPLGLIGYFMLMAVDAVIHIWRGQITKENFAEMRGWFIVALAQNPNYIRDAVVEMVKDKDTEVIDVLRWFLTGDPKERPSADEALLYFDITAQQTNQPECPPPVVMETDNEVLTSPTQEVSLEISLKKKRPPPAGRSANKKEIPISHGGGGKDIKNQLKQKILRRKSLCPYQQKEAKVVKPQEKNPDEADCLIPDFSALLG